jgi:asparagine synthase (glutamine-hydrolysing)
VRRVLAETGIPGHEVWPSARRLLESFDQLYYHQEEPFPSTSLFASFLVHECARQHGVRVMLDGQGADEFLAGYAHYPALILSDLVSRWRFARWWRERNALRHAVGVDPVPPRAALRRVLSGHAGLIGELDVDQDRGRPAFLRQELDIDHGREGPRRIPVRGGALKTRLYADLMLGHLQELLRYTDRNAMASSIEVRLPFLDHRLVEFALRLKSNLLYRDGSSKWVLRRAMRGIVPREILERTDKVGFATPWAAWWSSDHATTLLDRLRDSERELAELVIPDAISPGTPQALGIMAMASSRTQLRCLAQRPAAVA